MTSLAELLDEPDVAEVIFRRHDDPGKHGNYTVCVIPATGTRPYEHADSHGGNCQEALDAAAAYHRLPR
jgi:hypothetical protein